MTFTVRMKSFTEHLSASIHERGDALERVRDDTGRVLEGAREFVEDVAASHRAMAGELHQALADDRTCRCDRVAEMRGQHREELDRMRAESRAVLAATRRARNESVQHMKETFATARNDLAKDLNEAAEAWRAFASGR